MRNRALVVAAAAALAVPGLCAAAQSGEAAANPDAAIVLVQPAQLSLVQEPESIYAPAEVPKPEEGVNAGGVHLQLDVTYLTDYVYRGIDHSEVGGAEDAPNLQFDGKLSFDLGKLPHPFVGLFVNVYNDDPVSRFQEIRPYGGFDLNLRPLLITAGAITYIYPERERGNQNVTSPKIPILRNTSEVFTQITLDDTFIFHTEHPVLSPYVYGAYDLDQYDGLYLEAGVKHEIPLPDIGINLTAVADVAWVLNNAQFTYRGNTDTGFQHYDIGLIANYSLNPLLNLPKRYGDWNLIGYLYYTDGIEKNLRADTQIWGGMGIRFAY